MKTKVDNNIESCCCNVIHGEIVSEVKDKLPEDEVLYDLAELFKVFGDLVFQKESLGGGDIKLMFIIGLFLGFDMSIVTVFIASFIALPLSVISLIRKNNNVLPFGPYLSIAATIILFCNLNLDKILLFFTK